MNLKELIFGEGVHTGGSGGVYRDSVQAWLPIKNIIGGVVITKDTVGGSRSIRVQVISYAAWMNPAPLREIWPRGEKLLP